MPSKLLNPRQVKNSEEDEQRLQHHVRLLRDWIAHQNHLPKYYDEAFLTNFVRGCKFDLKRAKDKFERYFVLKALRENLLGPRVISMDGELKATTHTTFIVLPECTEEGLRITFSRVKDKDASVFNMDECVRYGFLLNDFRLHHDNMSRGEILICDCENYTAGHVAKSLTQSLKLLIDGIENAYPARLRQCHIVTDRPAVVTLVAFVKKFMSDKLKQRVHVHKNWDALYEFVPRKLLPSDYGGDQKSRDEIAAEWTSTLRRFENWFRDCDEVKMVGEIPKHLEHVERSCSETFGAEGSFRQLNID